MVAHLVRLKLTLLRNGLRRSAWQVVAMAFGMIYGLGALAVATAGVVALAVSGTLDVQRTVLVTVGSAVLLGWVVLPLAAFGVDATLDPARFVTFPIPRRELLVGLGLSGLVGIPGAVTVLAFAGTTLVWWRHPAAVLVALVAAALAVVFCLVASRAATTSLAPVLSGRRGREVTGFVVLVVVAVGYLGFGRLTRVGIGVGDRFVALLGNVARVLGWTPLGAAGPPRPTSPPVGGAPRRCVWSCSSRASRCSRWCGTARWPGRSCSRSRTSRPVRRAAGSGGSAGCRPVRVERSWPGR